MNTYAGKKQENKSQSVANTATQKRSGSESIFQFVDNRPEAVAHSKLQEMITNSPREIAQRKKIDSLFGRAPEGAPTQLRESDDLLSRGKQGKLKDGEVELIHQPKVGPMSLPDLEQSLKPVSNPSAKPVADALGSKSANMSNGKIQMKGIDGSSDPTSIAQQVSQLNPKETRIQLTSNDRFEVQAKLNPWVSVLTGTPLPELDHPQEEQADYTPHPNQQGVIWLNEPLKQYAAEGTYQAFMHHLEEVDRSTLDPRDKQQIKTRLLAEFHDHLKTLPVSEIASFGQELQSNIQDHEENDSLDKAFDETRAIYRSWHEPSRISESDGMGAMVKGGQELVGADGLNAALNPTRFRNHKTQTKEPGSKLVPLGAIPSSLLYPDQNNTVFNNDRGTATALLPENLYAGFSAYNETVKSLLREKSYEELGKGAQELGEHAKLMRASVTRPVFFNKSDIQSSTGAYEHDEKPNGPHVRKTHFDLGLNHNPLMETLGQKLADPLRSNALFYQTFSQHSKANLHADEWNEMVVKYRATGHTAGLHKNIRDWVPGLQPHQAIYDRLGDSGKFNAEYAAATAKWAKDPLRGEDFDPKIEKKKGNTKRKGKGKGRN
jgi:hypothetical protein